MSEYMTAQEALTWIITADAEFSSKLRDAEPIPWAIQLAQREMEFPRVRKSERATRLLAERCAAGRVLSKGYRVGTDKLSGIDTAEWLKLKVTVNFEVATKYGLAVFVDPVFRRKDILDQFPPPTPDPALTTAETAAPTDPPEAVYRTGTPGRPTSIQLVLAEASRRLAGGTVVHKLAPFADSLSKWLRDTHSAAPPMTKETIAGHPAFKSLVRRTQIDQLGSTRSRET